MRDVYLDNAATTRVSGEAVNAMLPYFMEEFGNPANEYRFCDKVRRDVERSRKLLASMLGADPFEIYFTSGGSEADNWAILGAASHMKEKGKHIITSKIEHHAVLRTCEYLEEQGYEVTYLDVDEHGIVDPEQVKKAIRSDTILISVMYANNEVGSLQPVKEIGRIAGENGILFHTDAVQAFGHIPIDVKRSGIRMLSVSAHKLGGPKGVGFLYIDRNVSLPRLIHGGDQESGKRAGTLNTPGIIGFAKAAELAKNDMEMQMQLYKQLKDRLIDRVIREIPESRLNGSRKQGLENIVNFSFARVDGSALLYSLEERGIYVSAGSACTAASRDTSHVLRAMSVPKEYLHGTVRISFSTENTMEEVDYVTDELSRIVAMLRTKR